MSQSIAHPDRLLRSVRTGIILAIVLVGGWAIGWMGGSSAQREKERDLEKTTHLLEEKNKALILQLKSNDSAKKRTQDESAAAVQKRDEYREEMNRCASKLDAANAELGKEKAAASKLLTDRNDLAFALAQCNSKVQSHERAQDQMKSTNIVEESYQLYRSCGWLSEAEGARQGLSDSDIDLYIKMLRSDIERGAIQDKYEIQVASYESPYIRQRPMTNVEVQNCLRTIMDYVKKYPTALIESGQLTSPSVLYHRHSDYQSTHK